MTVKGRDRVFGVEYTLVQTIAGCLVYCIFVLIVVVAFLSSFHVELQANIVDGAATSKSIASSRHGCCRAVVLSCYSLLSIAVLFVFCVGLSHIESHCFYSLCGYAS